MDQTRIQMLGDEALRCIEEKWRTGGVPYRPELLTALYTEKALFYGGLAPLYSGRDQIRGYFDHYVGLVASSVITLRNQEFAAFSNEEIAAQGIVEFTFGLADGRSTSLTQRSTLIMQRIGCADWLVSLQHFSVQPVETPVPL